MRVYLDNCVFNRPFDDQTQGRIRTETEAILYILEEIASGGIELVWSHINESENLRNENEEVKALIFGWKTVARIEVLETENLLRSADLLLELGLTVGDALHVAAAAEGDADLFLTTDDKLIRKVSVFEGVIVLNPTEAMEKLNEYIN